MLLRWSAVTLLFCILNSPCFAEEKEIAITIDDLPFVGSGAATPASLKRTQARFMAIVKALVDNQVPATGFAIGGAIPKSEWDLLETFRNQGFALGNHTYTHKSLNSMSADKYIADIDHADTVLAPVMTEPKYFRYPYLAEGTGQKKQKVYDYLAAHQYTIAPVTIDSKDYEFNARFYKIPYRKRAQSLPEFKKRYLAYIWKQTLLAERRVKKVDGQPVKQILLIHANLLNSLCLEDIIELYRKNGYKFISLADALRDDAVQPLNGNTEALNSVIPPVKGTLEQSTADKK
ncbi:polysaccharide deacetylase family protein [Fluoribacter gormanii]|uniref:Peptidoglycan/xylan/chitin deacetylase, PgdA/CDA1 family n=1 Tax=Fluoribacter gormanii TaxID=464 RepID=A0A377GK60_9GAMM|nr:polysaccharide deacetylase family protein [Fluoribacter gormanii]KTD02487.1 polysaccharide deacetylase [Fluoribacter gormanii]MCW8471719.1 polysaccharide deacetylase family protein [Fluoribacter gormanii]SIR45820.1 Peptidoglycan/xylan/chitin deacetylase, PgdA/CDA1 family [Fluoribacter gormanii]STO25171.1 polysaccharide deacetylase family sporulation protein PdaB [Fluoribacter gormanii]